MGCVNSSVWPFLLEEIFFSREVLKFWTALNDPRSSTPAVTIRSFITDRLLISSFARLRCPEGATPAAPRRILLSGMVQEIIGKVPHNSSTLASTTSNTRATLSRADLQSEVSGLLQNSRFGEKRNASFLENFEGGVQKKCDKFRNLRKNSVDNDGGFSHHRVLELLLDTSSQLGLSIVVAG